MQERQVFIIEEDELIEEISGWCEAKKNDIPTEETSQEAWETKIEKIALQYHFIDAAKISVDALLQEIPRTGSPLVIFTRELGGVPYAGDRFAYLLPRQPGLTCILRDMYPPQRLPLGVHYYMHGNGSFRENGRLLFWFLEDMGATLGISEMSIARGHQHLFDLPF